MGGEDSRIKKWICEQESVFADKLISLINVDTTPGREENVFPILVPLLEALGFDVDQVALDPAVLQHPIRSLHDACSISPGRANLRASLPVCADVAPSSDSIILNTHIDVVPADGFANAFSAYQDGGIIFGRGACDNKNNIVMVLEAIRCCLELAIPIRKNIIWDLVVEEEIGGNGTLSVVLSGQKADAAIVFEPTSLHIYRGHRGCVTVTIDCQGLPVHMGEKNKGVNAIENAAHIVQLLSVFEDELVQSAREVPGFDHWLYPVQVNVASIQGGDWHGSVPEHCEIVVNIGFLPTNNCDTTVASLEAFLDLNVDKQLRELVSIKKSGIQNESYLMADDASIIQDFTLVQKNAGIEQQVVPGWNVSCDARYYFNQLNIPTIVFGCGDLRHAHSNNEQIALQDLTQGIAMMVDYLTH